MGSLPGTLTIIRWCDVNGGWIQAHKDDNGLLVLETSGEITIASGILYDLVDKVLHQDENPSS